MGKELVVIQPIDQGGSEIWPNVHGNLSQPNEATILECIGQARIQDTLFFNDLDRRSNYRNRTAAVQAACLYAELRRHSRLLEKILADRGITLASNTDPLQAKLNGLVQVIGYGGMPAQLQAYEYSRRGKAARGILLLAADNNLICSLATADEIRRRFGRLTQTAVFERVDQERQDKATQRPAATKPAPSISSAKCAPSISPVESVQSVSSSNGISNAQTPERSNKKAPQRSTCRSLAAGPLDHLTSIFSRPRWQIMPFWPWRERRLDTRSLWWLPVAKPQLTSATMQ